MTFYRAAMMEGSGTLEDQLEATKVKISSIVILQLDFLYKCIMVVMTDNWSV